MGQPKALLDLGGETALSRILRLLRQARPAGIVLVLGPALVTRLRGVDLQGVTTVVNGTPERGLLSSLRVGLHNLATGSEAFLLCPVDVPLFETSDLDLLEQAWQQRAESSRIFVPTVAGRRGHPALYDRALIGEFLALRDDQAAHAVIRRDPGRVVHLASENRELVADLDTPEDLRAALLRREPTPD